MSILKIQFTTDSNPEYWEDEQTLDNESPKDCAIRIVKYFNDTLRPGEKSRKLLKVRIHPEQDIKINHNWEKQNSFTIIDKPYGSHDNFKCSRCGATGKRYGLGPSIIIDYKCRGKKNCK